VIRQAALYLSTADDLQAVGLPVAGHPVVFRIIMAAIRAGARRVGVPAVLRSPALEAALAASPRARVALAWLDTAGALAAEPTLLLPAAALAPAPVLGRLLQASPGGVLAESQSSAAPVLTVDASLLAVLHPALVAGAPLGDALERELKSRDHASIPGGGWFVHVTGERAAAEAEARLRGDLGSPVDSWLDTALHRRLSKPVTRVAVALGVAPNPITVISGVVGLAAAASMALGDATALVVGLLLYLLAVVLDHVDGEVARLTLTESAIGEWLDIVMDTVVHIALVLALGVAAERVTGAGLAGGVVGAVGVVASAVVYKRWPPAPPTAADRGLLDGLTSRDGFYAMLLIFIALRLAAPSRLPGLMMLIAVGTHAYWVARAALSLRPGRARGRRP
jgi:phosphatidylglycerophosphate synthase